MAALTSVVPTSGNYPEIPDSSVKQGVCVWHGADHYNYDVIVSVGGKRCRQVWRRLWIWEML